MRSEQSFAEKLKQRQAQQRRQDAAREAETDAEFRARVLREMTDPVGHAAGAGLNAAQAKRRPPPPGPAALPVDGQGAYARAPRVVSRVTVYSYPISTPSTRQQNAIDATRST